MKVFYRPEQNAVNQDAYSPSAAKPALVVRDWLDRGLIQTSDILSFEPVSRADLKRAHASGYVDGVLDLRVANGFGSISAEVAASLPYTSGSLLAAARFALDRSQNVCSPTSGFHHAHYSHGGGFCTFNGLMVTAMALLSAGQARSIGILDCDVHFGDGTEDIIRTHSVKGIRHHTMGSRFHLRDDAGPYGRHFLDWLDRAIEDCRDVDLLIYQAGADPHEMDPLGGILSSDVMAARDEAVFKAFRNRALVWNLAGGYQRDEHGGIEPVLALHRATVQAQNKFNL